MLLKAKVELSPVYLDINNFTDFVQAESTSLVFVIDPKGSLFQVEKNLLTDIQVVVTDSNERGF